MTKKFLDSLVSEHQYLVVPVGFSEALKQHGIKSPAVTLTAQVLFALAYRRHRQYHGKVSGIACRTSLTQLQQLTALSRSTVQTSIERLEAAGLIQKGDTDKRGTLFDVSKLAEIFRQHARKQLHPKSKDNDPGSSSGNSSNNSDSPTPKPSDSTQKRTLVDPAINEELISKLKTLEKQIQQLKEELNRSQKNDPAAMIRQLRMSLKHGKSAIDEKTRTISEQLTALEQERDRIRLEIERIRKALAQSERHPDSESKPLPKRVAAKPKRPARNHLKWMMRRLKEIRVSNPMETACEVLWALENGWYATSSVAQAWKPFQALASALKLIEQGRWRSPSGCEGWRYQRRILMAIGMEA